MCCGKMIRFMAKEGRRRLTTKNINVDLDKKGVNNENNKGYKRNPRQR